MSIDRGMDKEEVEHTYSGILLRHEKEWVNAICSNMHGTRDYHPRWNKSERERQITYDITYRWNLKYDTNELTFKTERLTDTENGLEGAKGGMDGEFGINRGKLVYIDWITSKVLRHSTEKYIQHPMINCNGKEHRSSRRGAVVNESD